MSFVFSSNKRVRPFGGLPKYKKANLMMADGAEANRGSPRNCWRVGEAHPSSMAATAILKKVSKS